MSHGWLRGDHKSPRSRRDHYPRFTARPFASRPAPTNPGATTVAGPYAASPRLRGEADHPLGVDL